MRCQFVPDYLLERIAWAPESADADSCRRTREIDAQLREQRSITLRRPSTAVTTGRAWQVHDAENGSALPGVLVRTAGDPEVSDVAVNEAATGIGETLALYADYGRSSYDGKGATVVASVHYEKDYDNAFWDGTQLVFGDGDGVIFGRFTAPIDVLGHELSHALVEFTAGLVYEGQPGALNESVSDVFGACMKQRHLGQDAASADWLVGEGIFLPGINGRALRSMEAPGTAYDDPKIGRDPQVGHFDDYIVTTEDNGGVHLNSGIPNRAFVLAAREIGGPSWSGAGQIWYDALTSGVAPDSDFATFAAATVDLRRGARGCRLVGLERGGGHARSCSRPARPLPGEWLGRGGPQRWLRRAAQAGLRRPRLRRSPRAPCPGARRPHRLRRRTPLGAAAGPLRLRLPVPRRIMHGVRGAPHPRPAQPCRPRAG